MTHTVTAQQMQAACVKLLGELGPVSSELRMSPAEGPESPVVWIAIATFANGVPQVAAHLSPRQAYFRLLEQLIDGGICLHCGRPSAITMDFGAALPFACWFQYDPELSVFRRGCS